MTESDLRNARDEVEGRLDNEQERRRRTVIVAGAAVAAVVVAVVGVAVFQTLGDQDQSAPPANPLPTEAPVDTNDVYLNGVAPTSELLDGVWRVDNGTGLLLFAEDGTVQFDNQGTLYSDPARTATYEIDGDQIVVTTTDDPDSTCIGAVSAIRASSPTLGFLRFVPAEASSGACNPLPPGMRGALEQVLPLNPDFVASFRVSTEPGWKPLPDQVDLNGVYFAEGGGHVLELAPDGSYHVADDSGAAVDQGQWSRLAAELTLTSSADSSECSAGDRLVLGGLEQAGGSGPLVILGTVDQNTCGGAWTPPSWNLLPQAGG